MNKEEATSHENINDAPENSAIAATVTENSPAANGENNATNIRHLANELQEHLTQLEAESKQAAADAEAKALRAQEALDQVAKANLAVKEAQEEQARAERYMQEMAVKARNLRKEAAQASLAKIDQDIVNIENELTALEEAMAALSAHIGAAEAKVEEKEADLSVKEQEAEDIQIAAETAQEEAQKRSTAADIAKAQAAAAKAMAAEAELLRNNLHGELAKTEEMIAVAKAQLAQHEQLKNEAAAIIANLEEESAAAPPITPEKKGSMATISKHDLPAGKAKKKNGALLNLVLCVLIGIGLAFVVRTYLFQLADIEGTSMQPTLQDGNRVVISKLAYETGKVQRGDIVLLLAPGRMDKYFIKRIIGMPGDHIKISGGSVYLNDQLFAEPYLAAGTQTNGEIDTIVPENCYFVMGDNRTVSYDSRFETLGFIKAAEIRGAAVLRVWPLKEWGSLSL